MSEEPDDYETYDATFCFECGANGGRHYYLENGRPCPRMN